MLLPRDERMPASVRGCGMSWAGDLEASRNGFSPLLTVTDSASVVTHTEPHDDFDDCGLDVCPGNPDIVEQALVRAERNPLCGSQNFQKNPREDGV